MSNANDIKLVFDNTISNLTGNKYGKVEFENQVKDKIDYKKPFVLRFPPNIRNIASSFIQGFFDSIVNEIGIKGIENNVDIISETIPDAKNYILTKLKF